MKAEFVENDIPGRQGADATRWVDVERLGLDDYDTAPAQTRRHMLACVFARVFAAASPAGREEVLAQLLRPLGMLSLVRIANGAFTRFKLQEIAPNGFAADVRQLDLADLGALVEWVQQVNFEALQASAEVLLSDAELAHVSLGRSLRMMLARGVPVRRCND